MLDMRVSPAKLIMYLWLMSFYICFIQDIAFLTILPHSIITKYVPLVSHSYKVLIREHLAKKKVMT